MKINILMMDKGNILEAGSLTASLVEYIFTQSSRLKVGLMRSAFAVAHFMCIAFLTLFILTLLMVVFMASPLRANIMVENINGITLDTDGELHYFSAIIFDDKGRVLALKGDEKGKRDADKIPVRERIDGKGRTLIPGFHDAHGHLFGLGLGVLTLDVSGAKTLDEALRMIADFGKENAERPWIIGRGWNQEKWGLGRYPTAKELDAVIADRPVWLMRVDGHAGWANSQAMKVSGVDAQSTAPQGGEIIRGEGGRPSGIFVDHAMELIASHAPKPRASDLDNALQQAQNILLKAGVTSMADMGTSIEHWQSLRRAGDYAQLKMRVIAYASSVEDMFLIAGQRPTPWLYNDRLRMVGIKLYIDGALGSRGAWLREDYADAPGTRGLSLMSHDQLRNRMSLAALNKFQPAVHAIGDAANKEILSAIDRLSKTYGVDRRWRVEHAQHVPPELIGDFARVGAIASMQPVHQSSDRLMAQRRLGPDRLAGSYAWKSIIQSGARLAFGTDFPIESPNPFVGMAVAMTREDADGEPFGGWLPEERLDRLAAWYAYTIGGAYAAQAEGRIGSLMPGYYADFLLIDEPFDLTAPHDLRNIKVQKTYVGGQLVYDIDRGG